MKKAKTLSTENIFMSEDEEEPREETVMRDNEQEKSLCEIEVDAKELCNDESILGRVANHLHDDPTILLPSLISRQSSSFFNGADNLDDMFTDLPPKLTALFHGAQSYTLKTRRSFAFDESKEPMRQDYDDDDATAFLGNIGLCHDDIDMIPSSLNQQQNSEAVGPGSMPSGRCLLLNSPATVIGMGGSCGDYMFQEEEVPRTISRPTHSLFGDDIEDYLDAPAPKPGNVDLGYQKSFNLLDGCFLDTF